MSVYAIDPLADSRWAGLLDRHPDASVFHSREWLEALNRTYGWRTWALTTSPPGRVLSSGLPVCDVTGLFGRHRVSLPFSDHCEPLLAEATDLEEMAAFLAGSAGTRACRYIELRPSSDVVPFEPLGGPSAPSASYCLHRLDLSDGSAAVFRRFHPSCIQRAIRRAEREGLTCETGATPNMVQQFHRLLCMSRRRHGVPPQPIEWFRNLATGFGARYQIRLALKQGVPVAGIVTMTFKKTVVYKYGGSDPRYHSLGGMPLLFWRAVVDATDHGIERFDLGRSDWNQPGLLAFKDHLGARRWAVTYFRYPRPTASVPGGRWLAKAARGVFSHMPRPALSLAGRVLYRHLG